MTRLNRLPTGFYPGLLEQDPENQDRFVIDPDLAVLEVGSVPRGRMVRFAAGRVSVSQPAAWLFERIDLDPRAFLAMHMTATWGQVDLFTEARNEVSIETGSGRVESIYQLEKLFGILVAFGIETTLGGDEPRTTIEVYREGWRHAVSS